MADRKLPMRRLAHAACSLLMLTLAACGGGGGGGSASGSSMSAAAQVGEKLFSDTILSSTGAMSCASCHDKGNHHAAPDSRSVPAGAEAGHEAGRQAPTLQYLKFNTRFAFAADGTPTGGFTWDGRAATLAEQAGGPLLNPNEMANADVGDVVAKLSYRLSQTQRRHIVTRGAGRRGIIPPTRDGSLRLGLRSTDNPAPTVTVADAHGDRP